MNCNTTDRSNHPRYCLANTYHRIGDWSDAIQSPPIIQRRPVLWTARPLPLARQNCDMARDPHTNLERTPRLSFCRSQRRRPVHRNGVSRAKPSKIQKGENGLAILLLQKWIPPNREMLPKRRLLCTYLGKILKGFD